MLKNLVKNSFWIAIAFFCAMCTSYSQVYGPTAQNPFPAGSALINIAPDADGHLTMGGEYKQPKNVVEQEKPVCWEWYADVGYWTEYNFRGVDLTPNSDGSICCIPTICGASPRARIQGCKQQVGPIPNG